MSAAQRRPYFTAADARAVEWLNRARAAGYFTNPVNREMLRTEKAFTPLYGRPDFWDLHAAVEAEADTR